MLPQLPVANMETTMLVKRPLVAVLQPLATPNKATLQGVILPMVSPHLNRTSVKHVRGSGGRSL